MEPNKRKNDTPIPGIKKIRKDVGAKEKNEGHRSQPMDTGHGSQTENHTGHGSQTENHTGHGSQTKYQTGHGSQTENQMGHGSQSYVELSNGSDDRQNPLISPNATRMAQEGVLDSPPGLDLHASGGLGRKHPPTPNTPRIFEEENSPPLKFVSSDESESEEKPEFNYVQEYARQKLGGISTTRVNAITNKYADLLKALPIPKADGQLIEQLHWHLYKEDKDLKNHLHVRNLTENGHMSTEDLKLSYTEQEIKELATNKKYIGLAKDIRLMQAYNKTRTLMGPYLGLANLLVNDKEPTKEDLMDMCKHGIQIGANMLHNITLERRINIMDRHPSFQSKNPNFVRDPNNYAITDAPDLLFGKTFYHAHAQKLEEHKNYMKNLNAYNSPTKRPQSAPTNTHRLKSKVVVKSSRSYRGRSQGRSNHTQGGRSNWNSNRKDSRYVPSHLTDLEILLNTLGIPLDNHGIPWTPAELPKIEFLGGRICFFEKFWKKITHNMEILNLVRGSCIEFDFNPKSGGNLKSQYITNPKKLAHIEELLKNRVIEKGSQGGTISNIFFREKSSGELRMILNLKSLNEAVVYKYFMLQSLEAAMAIVNPGDFFVKVDLKSAYDSVLVAKNFRKYLGFNVNGQIYQYRGWPNGLACCPRLFTLLMKPVSSFLGKNGIRNVIYLDDILIMNSQASDIIVDLSTVIQLLSGLGFLINLHKSITEPTQSIEFLGIIINSVSMETSLPEKKLKNIQSLADSMVKNPVIKIQELASVVGKINAARMGILAAPLHYRGLQMLLIEAVNAQGWTGAVTLNQKALQDLAWWIKLDPRENKRKWILANISKVISSDASNAGWGAAYKGKIAQGPWTREQSQLHINTKEMIAADMAVQSFLKEDQNMVVQLETDNMTTLVYIHKMGGTKNKDLNAIAIKIWEWCLARGIILIVKHIPGIYNKEADLASREFRDNSDWKLCPQVFNQIQIRWGPISIDLFAKHWNRQVRRFYSWGPQPETLGQDALCQTWDLEGNFAFPPFCLIPKVVKKVRTDKVDLILVTPVSPTRTWYSTLLQLSIDYPLLLPNKKDILTNAQQQAKENKLPMCAWKLSANSFKRQGFLKKLQRLSQTDTERIQKFHMDMPGVSGIAGAMKGKSVPFQVL